MKNSLGVMLAVLFVVFFSNVHEAQADLVVDVQGELGSGQTTWTFSGSYLAEQSATVLAGNNSLAVPTAFNGIGDVVGGFSGSITKYFSELGTVQLVGSTSGLVGIDAILFYNGGGNLDSFGFSLANDHTFVQGETLSFSGSSTTDLDFNNLRGDYLNRELPYSITRTTAGGTTLQMNFSAVPEPSSIACLLGLGTVSLIGFRRRRR